MLKNISKRINNWYLEKFQDTTREDDGITHDSFDDKSVIGIDLKMSFKERLRFLITGKYSYRLNNREVYFIKNYKIC